MQVLPFVTLSFLVVQQLLCSTMSVFSGLGIGCLIEYFQSKIEKLVYVIYPLFEGWVQLDYHNLKKLLDMSISIRRFFCVHSLIISTLERLLVTQAAQCGAWNQWCTAHKKSRNARISHSENPAKSDALKVFLHLLSTEP